MTFFSPYPLQKAIYQALTDDTALMAMVSGAFDRVPQGTAFPYITLGESRCKDWSSKTTSGTEQMIALHVWSREGGRKETSLVMERIYELLHRADLSVEDHTLTLLHFDSSKIELENDGATYQGTLFFRALLESNS